ncbi:LysR family transcriptional regulator [Halomonas sp. LR3S48]|uniref:LysR family transcriptional regulator n=1 Tax=Halomonas sp. LR3S48 TaxID=2982694 RepID=UPI0021E4ECAF|nr:LysR family transcriptional regulator [Halomonas sp. LR3S48]UYG05509.1 LysR family transcriptional regulator [Halomonas sp. LR3S48]
MNKFTLHELHCFVAVVDEGGFQAAAAVLNRSHAAIFAALAKLERQFNIALLDRSGYRVQPTEAGLSLYRRAQSILRDADALSLHAQQMAMGEETELNVVIGDLCPRSKILGLLSRFFAACPHTRLQLHYEAVTGPWERLLNGEADLILHRVDKSDLQLEWIDIGTISLIPVVAPGFLPFPITNAITPEQMRELTQCVLRDTAQHAEPRNYYVVGGPSQCSVADHEMKKDFILQGMAWGHLPRFMIEEELHDGRLLSIAGRHFPGVTEELVVGRRRDRPHGPVAQRLWEALEAQAPVIERELAGR